MYINKKDLINSINNCEHLDEDKIICENAWRALQEISYDENGVKLFEKICCEMDNGTYGGFNFEIAEITEDGKMMVSFESFGFEPKTYEFRYGCREYMLDTLCYKEEAKYFLELLDELL